MDKRCEILRLRLQSRNQVSIRLKSKQKIKINNKHHNLNVIVHSSTPDQPSPFANMGPINIYHMQSSFIFDEPILRSLIAEASSIFKAVQEIQPATQDKRSGGDYLKLSRTYRSTVRACLEKLQDALAENAEQDDDDDDAKRITLENYITIFYSVECVWHLCEILLIDKASSQVVVPQLLDWIRFHFPAYERRASELLFVDGDDIDDDVDRDILKVVKGLITQGQVDVGRTLLRLHPDADSTCFQLADAILKAMPVYNVSVREMCLLSIFMI